MSISSKEIKAKITIVASYDHGIKITVEDESSSTQFLELTMTKEQFVDAAMNRLACTKTEHAVVRGLDRIGKKMEMSTFEFPMSELAGKQYDLSFAELQAKKYCPKGWEPEMYFGAQDSFFIKDGLHYARATIRRWV